MSNAGNKAEVQKVLAKARQQGCEVILRRSGHYKIITPSGEGIFCAQTPSDYRGVKRTISRLRQAGIDV